MAAAAAIGCAGAAHAGPYSDALSKCLVDSSSPKDHLALVQWMFSGLSANPAVKPMSSVTPAQREGYSRAVAATFDRLVLEQCHGEAVSALRYEGGSAMEASFAMLGKVAAAGLMSEPLASAELERFTNYVDQTKWDALGKEAGMKPSAPATK